MSNRNLKRVRKIARSAASRYQRQPYLEEGWLGDYSGNVEVGDNQHLVYVRVRGVVVVAYDDQTSHEANTPVVVGYDEANPRLYKVLGTLRRSSVDLGPSWSVGKHAERHRYGAKPGGDDVVWIEQRQILPLRVGAASTGLAVLVWPGIAYTSNGWAQVEQLTSLDLSSYQPASAGYARYVLVYLDPDDDIAVVAGSEVTPIDALQLYDIPAVPAGGIALAAVRLYNGQTSISENLYNPDIIDLRGPTAGGGENSLDEINRLLALIEAEYDFALTKHVAG